MLAYTFFDVKTALDKTSDVFFLLIEISYFKNNYVRYRSAFRSANKKIP